MPAFSTSLGCLDASHFYHADTPEGAFYTLPVPSVSGGVDIKIQGSAPGTLTLSPSTSVNEEHVMVRVNVRSSDAAYFNVVSIDSVIHKDGQGTSRLALGTPGVVDKGSCVRYDLTVYVPPTLRNLTINALSPIHLHTAFDDAPRVLHALSVYMRNTGAGEYVNILKGEKGLQVDEMNVMSQGGYIVGAMSVGNTTSIDTSYSSTVSKLELVTSGYDLADSPSPSHHGALAHIKTYTGTGLSTFTLTNEHDRPISATHLSTSRASGQGDLRLEYAGARFSGVVDVKAKSYSMRGVQSEPMKPGMPMGSENRWVGNKDGGDYVQVKTEGWAGLYF